MPLTHATDRRIAIEGCDARTIEGILRFVRERIDSSEGDEPVVASCAQSLVRARGVLAIDALVAESRLSRRQFERRFRETVGLSPRLFANVLRLRSVFDALKANPDGGWTDAALAAGYFDQSHLIRDFKRFVGCTPAQFLRAEHGLATAIALSA
jgi:AraC-like DNA-binding protein